MFDFIRDVFRWKYKAILLLKHADSYDIYKTIKLDPLTRTVRLKARGNGDNRTVKIDLSHPSYTKRMTHIYIIDVDSGMQIVFYPLHTGIDPTAIDKFVFGKIFFEMLQSIKRDKPKINLTLIAMMLLIGGILGYVISMYI